MIATFGRCVSRPSPGCLIYFATTFRPWSHEITSSPEQSLIPSNQPTYLAAHQPLARKDHWNNGPSRGRVVFTAAGYSREALLVGYQPRRNYRLSQVSHSSAPFDAESADDWPVVFGRMTTTPVLPAAPLVPVRGVLDRLPYQHLTRVLTNSSTLLRLCRRENTTRRFRTVA